jgi:hypothetical protein
MSSNFYTAYQFTFVVKFCPYKVILLSSSRELSSCRVLVPFFTNRFLVGTCRAC